MPSGLPLPLSTIRPAYMTWMSSQKDEARPRSCVIRIIPIRRSSTICPSSSMIRACVVTSSAVVGSSATRTSGFVQIAIAIITRWRIPPEELVRMVVDAALGLGESDVAEHGDRAIARLAPADALVRLDRLHDLPPDRHQRVQRRHRILVDGRDLAAADARHLALGRVREVASTQEDVAACDGRGAGQPHQRERRQRLAAPGLPHDAEPAPRAHLERDAADRADRIAPRHRDLDDEVANLEDDVGRSLWERRGHAREGRGPLEVVAQRVQRQHGERGSRAGRSSRCRR